MGKMLEVDKRLAAIKQPVLEGVRDTLDQKIRRTTLLGKAQVNIKLKLSEISMRIQNLESAVDAFHAY
jgi:hypothetical protein